MFKTIYFYIWYWLWIISPLAGVRFWIEWKLGQRKCRREGHDWKPIGSNGRARMCLRCTYH